MLKYVYFSLYTVTNAHILVIDNEYSDNHKTTTKEYLYSGDKWKDEN